MRADGLELVFSWVAVAISLLSMNCGGCENLIGTTSCCLAFLLLVLTALLYDTADKRCLHLSSEDADLHLRRGHTSRLFNCRRTLRAGNSRCRMNNLAKSLCATPWSMI